MPLERHTEGDVLQPEDCKIPFDKIEAIAADPQTRRDFEDRFGSRLYPVIFYCLTNETFDADHARLLWDEVNEHMGYLSQTLGKNPGITFATMDYFANWLSVPGSGKVV